MLGRPVDETPTSFTTQQQHRQQLGFGSGISSLEPANVMRQNEERSKAEEYKRALQDQMQLRKKKESDDRHAELAQVRTTLRAQNDGR
jgi:hypothetical protein